MIYKGLFFITMICAITVFAKSTTQEIFDSNKDRLAVVTTDDYGYKSVVIEGLTEDLFQRYVIQKSRGPAWQDDALSVIESSYDLHESTSYWFERVEPSTLTDDCGWELTEDEIDEAFSNAYADYQFTNWQAVKPKQGGKTLLYIVDQVTVLSWGAYSCEILEDQHVFQNTPSSKKQPVYLGRM